MFETASRSKGSTSSYLLRQRSYIRESGEVVRSSSERRAPPQPSRRVQHHVEIQPVKSTLVGRPVRETDRYSEESNAQDDRGSDTHLARVKRSHVRYRDPN